MPLTDLRDLRDRVVVLVEEQVIRPDGTIVVTRRAELAPVGREVRQLPAARPARRELCSVCHTYEAEPRLNGRCAYCYGDGWGHTPTVVAQCTPDRRSSRFWR